MANQQKFEYAPNSTSTIEINRHFPGWAGNERTPREGRKICKSNCEQHLSLQARNVMRLVVTYLYHGHGLGLFENKILMWRNLVNL